MGKKKKGSKTISGPLDSEILGNQNISDEESSEEKKETKKEIEEAKKEENASNKFTENNLLSQIHFKNGVSDSKKESPTVKEDSLQVLDSLVKI